MANKQGVNSTAGATGPRGDEPKENTANQQVPAALLQTFDEVDFSQMEPLGINPLNPQERHGSGVNSVSGQNRYGPNSGANLDPNMFSQDSGRGPNDAGNPSFEGEDFSENPRNLPHILPRDGYSNCWVRWFTADGQIDGELQRMMRRGYSPVAVSDVPMRDAMFLQKRKGFDGADMLSVSGMVLCEIPLSRLNSLMKKEQEAHQRNEKATLKSAQDANQAAGRRGSGMQIGIDSSDN